MSVVWEPPKNVSSPGDESRGSYILSENRTSSESVDRSTQDLSARDAITRNGKLNRDAVMNGSVKLANGNVANDRRASDAVSVRNSAHSMDVLSAGESEMDVSRIKNSTGTRNSGTGKSLKTQDHLYFVAKELLMTERTYKKDLDVITVWWSQRVMECGGGAALGRGCLAIGPVALAQGVLLASLDSLLHNDRQQANETSQPHTKVYDILTEHLTSHFETYMSYFGEAGACAGALEAAARNGAGHPHYWKPPLSLALHLLRPLHRALYYERIEQELGIEEQNATLLARAARSLLPHAHNHIALSQLMYLITSDENLLVSDRLYVRMGCVYKNTTKGPQQRMLFLFNDRLLCCARHGDTFRVVNSVPISSLCLKSYDGDTFTLQEGKNTATYHVENGCDAWVKDFKDTLNAAIHCGLDRQDTIEENNRMSTTSLCSGAVNTNNSGVGGIGALAWVCWHRGASLSAHQMQQAAQIHLSGHLLRKFKNSHGWQKLWVSLACFTLYFYKSWLDDAPLASLPLMGYRVTTPDDKDCIQKEYVFKLMFKNHVYFFRAESEYTFNRWMETLTIASCAS